MGGHTVSDACVKFRREANTITGFPLKIHKGKYMMKVSSEYDKRIVLSIESSKWIPGHEVTFTLRPGVASNLANVLSIRLEFVQKLASFLKSFRMAVAPTDIIIHTIDTNVDTVVWSIDPREDESCPIGKTLERIFHVDGKPTDDLRIPFAKGVFVDKANVTLSSICFPRPPEIIQRRDSMKNILQILGVVLVPSGIALALHFWCRHRNRPIYDEQPKDYMMLYPVETVDQKVKNKSTTINPADQIVRCVKAKEAIRTKNALERERKNGTSWLGQLGLSPTALSPSRLSPSALSPFGISPSGLSPPGISTSGLSPSLLSPSGLSPSGSSIRCTSVSGNGMASEQISCKTMEGKAKNIPDRISCVWK